MDSQQYEIPIGVDHIRHLRTADRITVKESVKCYYYDYPQGSNLVTFDPGDVATINAFPPKVRDYSKDGSAYFVLFTAKGHTFGTSWRNIQKVKGE